MAIRNIAIPLLGSGALLLGYVAFSRLRKRPSAPESNGPSTLREAGLIAADEISAAQAAETSTAESGVGEAGYADADYADTGPLSERAPDLPQFLELELEDLELEIEDPNLELEDLTFEREQSQREAERGAHQPSREQVGVRFLARATDALSPFGAHIDAHFEREQVDIDRFSVESSLRGPTAQAGKPDQPREVDAEREASAESERRPSLARTGGRS